MAFVLVLMVSGMLTSSSNAVEFAFIGLGKGACLHRVSEVLGFVVLVLKFSWRGGVPGR